MSTPTSSLRSKVKFGGHLKTWLEHILEGQARAAAKGNPYAAAFLFDHAFGKVPLPVEDEDQPTVINVIVNRNVERFPTLVYLRSGGDMKVTQEWLGHSNARATADTYVHTREDQQRKSADLISRAVFQSAELPAPGTPDLNSIVH